MDKFRLSNLHNERSISTREVGMYDPARSDQTKLLCRKDAIILYPHRTLAKVQRKLCLTSTLV